ncbi:XRN 5'-3' exonuclease N-terminus-domain-containing protein [Phakopsora pachyrhizi]|uniref:XRN 5'-3' exonuclease N-terminus-domain-containing protein n=1 Tax=Phakopsora pachyrhizi TaxID=170000 RepID=A0AAV0BNV7_PHAPC|nr:XRN 5'-3' exonuclease N-terminus-domain-containing protein [Phakopsora pachyrhizi]
MGVPALFRWLSRKYPKIVEQVFEDETIGSQGKKPSKTEQEMIVKVFRYTTQVVNMVRPTKLLMIEIGMSLISLSSNPNCSCCFKAAQEAKSKQLEILSVIQECRLLCKELSDEYSSDKKVWDSNAITHGTPFIKLLIDSLRYWISHKLNTNPGWNQKNYNPNTRHMIYGLDDDLITLSLATHEPHFKALREDVFSDERRRKGCHLCCQPGHHSSQCQGKPKERANEFDEKQKLTERKPFIFLDVSTLREFLAVEMNMVGAPFKFELKHAICQLAT